MTWKYQVVDVRGNELEKILNEMGQKGWQLVSNTFVPFNRMWTLVFEQECE